MPTVLEQINELAQALDAVAAGASDYDAKAIAYAVETAAQVANRRELRHLFDVPVDSLPVRTKAAPADPWAKADSRKQRSAVVREDVVRKQRRVEEAILRTITAHPGDTSSEIARRLRISRPYASTNVTRLVVTGRVCAVQDGMFVRFYPMGEVAHA